MKIALGMIVLDGLPILPYVIDSAIDCMDKVVIVEGAVPAAGKRQLRPDGFVSNDGTAEYLIALEGINSRVKVIRAGNTASKTDMWNLYLSELSGIDFVLNLDSDEVISSEEDLIADIRYLEENPHVDRLDLRVNQFYGDFNHTVSGGIWDQPFRRLWRVRPGAQFRTHRPPYMEKDEAGAVAPNLELFHYSWIGVERARKKSEFYQSLRPSHPQYGRHMEWYRKIYLRSLKDHSFNGIDGYFGLHVSEKGPLSVKRQFEGAHPESIRKALAEGLTIA